MCTYHVPTWYRRKLPVQLITFVHFRSSKHTRCQRYSIAQSILILTRNSYTTVDKELFELQSKNHHRLFRPLNTIWPTFRGAQEVWCQLVILSSWLFVFGGSRTQRTIPHFLVVCGSSCRSCSACRNADITVYFSPFFCFILPPFYSYSYVHRSSIDSFGKFHGEFSQFFFLQRSWVGRTRHAALTWVTFTVTRFEYVKNLLIARAGLASFSFLALQKGWQMRVLTNCTPLSVCHDDRCW